MFLGKTMNWSAILKDTVGRNTMDYMWIKVISPIYYTVAKALMTVVLSTAPFQVETFPVGNYHGLKNSKIERGQRYTQTFKTWAGIHKKSQSHSQTHSQTQSHSASQNKTQTYI